MQLARLDDVIPEMFSSSTRFFLKIDVQGFELPVLNGAESFLDACVGVEIEISFSELYAGQARTSEILDRLEVKNWQCIGIDPVFVDDENGFVLQADALFARSAYVSNALGASGGSAADIDVNAI